MNVCMSECERAHAVSMELGRMRMKSNDLLALRDRTEIVKFGVKTESEPIVL